MATTSLEGGMGDAQDRPQFVIEKGNRYYLTGSVFEYDPDATDVTQEQKDAVAQYRRMFEDAASRNKILRACEVGADVAETTEGPAGINTESGDGINTGGINTGPDGINTGSGTGGG